MSKVGLERWSRNVMSVVAGVLTPAKRLDPKAVRESLRATRSPKILFIRPHQGLGDLLLATPVFRALKAAYPDAEIHFLADTYNRIAIRDNMRLTKIWTWDKVAMKKPSTAWRFMQTLRAQKFDVAVPLFSHVPSFTSFMIARASGARVVWSYDTAPFYNGANWSRWLTHVERPNRPDTDPEWVKFMELIRPLLPESSPDDYAPEFFISKEATAWSDDRWGELGLPTATKKIGVFLGGNPDRPERLWPVDSWLALMQKFQATPDVSLVAIVPPKDLLSGSRAVERGVFGQIVPRLAQEPAIFADARLDYVAAFLKHLDLFIVVDGGLFHIAVASRVSTLGLFFVTIPERWMPPVPWVSVLRPPDDVPTSLSPIEVYAKAMSLLIQSPYAR